LIQIAYSLPILMTEEAGPLINLASVYEK